MKSINRKIMGVVTVAAAVIASGCQTTGGTQDQVAGLGIGAALGCAAGALIEGSAKGCAVGAAVGAAAGWAAVSISQYHTEQVRSSTADRRVYGLTKPVSSPQVKIQRATSLPGTVRAGQRVDILTDYSLRLPSGQTDASVEQSWALDVGGQRVPLGSKTAEQEDGGQNAGVTINVPADIEPGTYIVEHKIRSGSSYDTRKSEFVVRS